MANLHALGNEAAGDLDGRMILCEQRAKMIGQSLQALAHSDLEATDEDTINAFGQLARELAEEIEAIRNAYIDRANATFTAGQEAHKA